VDLDRFLKKFDESIENKEILSAKIGASIAPVENLAGGG